MRVFALSALIVASVAGCDTGAPPSVAGSFSAEISGTAADVFGTSVRGGAGYTNVGDASPTPFTLVFANAHPGTKVEFYVRGPFVAGETRHLDTETGSLVLEGLFNGEYRSFYSRSWTLRITAVSDGVIEGAVVADLRKDPERYGGASTAAGSLTATFRAEATIIRLDESPGLSREGTMRLGRRNATR